MLASEVEVISQELLSLFHEVADPQPLPAGRSPVAQ